MEYAPPHVRDKVFLEDVGVIESDSNQSLRKSIRFALVPLECFDKCGARAAAAAIPDG